LIILYIAQSTRRNWYHCSIGRSTNWQIEISKSVRYCIIMKNGYLEVSCKCIMHQTCWAREATLSKAVVAFISDFLCFYNDVIMWWYCCDVYNFTIVKFWMDRLTRAVSWSILDPELEYWELNTEFSSDFCPPCRN